MGKALQGFFTALTLLILLAVGVALGVALTTGGLLGLLGVNPQPTISAVTVLERVQSLAALTTSRYNFSSLVTSEREMPPLLTAIYGDRQVLLATGYIDAGVDLSALSAEDIAIAGNVLTLTLPGAALTACALDETATRVIERDSGIFAPNAPTLDSDARRFALAQFRDQALESGILGDAEDEARVVITALLLGTNPALERVNIEFDEATEATLPETCE
jgi:hypothetical protein